MNHTLFKGLLFLCAGAVLHETGTTDLGKLGGLSKRMPQTTVLFLVGAFSISGIPPFNGFASKWMIYQAAFEKSSTGGIGELANFLMGSALVLPAGLIYRRSKSRKTALIGCLVGSVCMGVMAAIANYFILLPMFQVFMPMDALIAAFTEFIPLIHTKLDVVLLHALPLNIFKGLLISLVTMLIYKRLSPILKGRK